MSCEALDVWHVALGATLGIAVLRWFRHSPRPSTIDHGKAYRETLDFRHRLRATELGIAGGPGGDLDALFADLPVRAPPGPASAGGSGAGSAVRPLRLMQWNLLADGLSEDGFLVDPVVDDWPVGPGEVPTNRAAGTGARKIDMLREIVAASQAGKGQRDAALQLVADTYSTAASQRNLAAVVDFEGRLLRMLYMISALDPDVITVQELDRMGVVGPALAALGYVCGGGGEKSGAAGQGASDPKPYTPLLATAPAVTADGYLAALREAGIAFAPTLGSTTHTIALGRWAGKALGEADGGKQQSSPFMEAFRQMGVDPALLPPGGGGGGAIGRKTLAALLKDPNVVKNGGLGHALVLAGAGEEEVLGFDNDGPAIFWKASRYEWVVGVSSRVGLCNIYASVYASVYAFVMLHLQAVFIPRNCSHSHHP